MDEETQKSLLRQEIAVLAQSCEIDVPDLTGMSLNDLQKLKKELRDLTRSLGGNRH